MRSLQAEQFFRGRSRVIERQTDRHTHTHTHPQERDMDICWLPCPLLPPKLSNEMPVWNRRKRAEDCGAELLHVEVCIRLFVSPWTVAHQAPVSMGFPSQEYWSGCHFFLQGIFLIQGLNPHLLHLLNWKADFLLLSHQGSLLYGILSLLSC